MKCKLCGYEIESGKDICGNCGTKVDSNDSWNLFGNNNLVFDEKPVNNTNTNTNTIIENTVNYNEQVNSKPEEENNSKKPNKFVILSLGLMAMVISLVVGFIVYFQVFTDTRTIYNHAIDKIFDEILKPINDKSTKTSGSISFSANIDSPTNSGIISIINKLSVSMDFDIDYIEQLVKANGKLIYDNNDIQGSFVAYDNYLYFSSNELYDKYIRYPFNYKDLLSSNGKYVNNCNDIIKELKKAITVSLKEDYFKTYDDKININGKEVKVTVNELIINNSNYKQIREDFYTYLYHSNKFIKAIASLTNKEEESIKESINSSLDSLAKENTFYNINLVMDVYTKGLIDSFVGLNIKYDNTNLSVYKTSKNTYSITLKYDDQVINTNITINKVKNKTIYVIDYENGNNKIKLNIGFDIYHHKRIKKPDLSNFIDYDKLTETDLENMRTKLEGNSLVSSLKRDLQSLENSSYKSEVGIFNR